MEDKEIKVVKKSNKKIVAITFSIAILLLAGTGIFFIVKDAKTVKTEYGSVRYIEAVDSETIKFTYSAPYSAKKLEYVFDENEKIILTQKDSGKSYDVKISEYEYAQKKSNRFKTATIQFTAKISDFSFESGRNYELNSPNGAIKEKTSNKNIGEIKFSFSVEKQAIGGKFIAKLLDEREYDIEEVENELSINEENGKFYVIAQVKTDTLTNLNKENIKKNLCGVTVAYQGEKIEMKSYFDDIEASYDEATKTVTIKCPIDKSIITSGTKYAIYISKGILQNKDKTIGSGEMNAELTYMG